MAPLQETIQAFKEHIGSFLEEPVVLEWPMGEKKAVHVFVYSVSDDSHLRQSENADRKLVIRALVFANPEYEYGSLGQVVQALQQHPVFEIEGSRCSVVLLPITTEEAAQIFVARNQPYRLAVAYELRSTTSKDT